MKHERTTSRTTAHDMNHWRPAAQCSKPDDCQHPYCRCPRVEGCNQTTNDLTDFEIVIEWHTLQRPEKMSVIARNIDDAKQIARRLFAGRHTEACVIDGIEEACK